MTTTVTVEVHDTPPYGLACEVVAYTLRLSRWMVADAPFVCTYWGDFTRWHLPIDVSTLNKEQP